MFLVVKLFLYLHFISLPLRAKASSNATWNPILENMGRKLTNWKGNYLSNGGKIILLKNVLASMPYFFLFPLQSSNFYCL